MPYTPVELRHVKLGRSLLGFSREETERVLGEVADSFEEVWRERGELTDRVDELEKRLADLRSRESLLSSTLVSAEKAAAEAKDAAKREAELIVAEAHGEARSIMRAAQSERERLFAEARRVEALLRAALGVVAETGEASAPAAAPPQPAVQADHPSPPATPQPPAALVAPAPPPSGPAPEHWPRREDTREFAVVHGSGEGAPAAVPDAPTPTAEPEPPRPAAREFAWGD